MSYDRILKEIESLKRKVERLSAMDAPQAFNPAVLDDYLLEADAALLYLGKNDKAADSNRLNGQLASYYSPAHSHPYLGVNDTAQNSDKLGGVSASGYVNTSGAQTINGVKTFGSLPTLPTTTPTINQPIRRGYADATYLKNPTWASYTPTVSYAGGTTNPTSITVTAKRCYMSKVVLVMIRMDITRGSGNRQYIKASMPSTVNFGTGGGCSHSLCGEIGEAAGTYFEGNNIVIKLKNPMSTNGNVWLSCFYEQS